MRSIGEIEPNASGLDGFEKSLPIEDQETIRWAKFTLEELKRKDNKNWDFYANEGLSYRLNELHELLARLSSGPAREEVSSLIEEINRSVPDSFETKERKEIG